MRRGLDIGVMSRREPLGERLCFAYLPQLLKAHLETLTTK